ncbi:g11513 [Coccomyxa elongata]
MYAIAIANCMTRRKFPGNSQGKMAHTTAPSYILAKKKKRRAMQVQFLRAQQAAVVEQLTAEQLAACPNEFLCPISLEIMYFPLILVATGQTYDLTSIDAWVGSGGTICPLTGLQLSGKAELRLNTGLRTQICEWLATQGVNDNRTLVDLARTLRAARSNGDTDTEDDQGAKQLGRRILAGVRAVLQFLASDTKLYNRIY